MSASAPKKERGANQIIWAAWRLLRPSWRDVLTGKELEAVGMLALALTKRWEINFMYDTVGALESTFTSRDPALFWGSLVRVVAISFYGSAVDMVYSFLESRLTWKWKRKLTMLLHEKYFDDKAYYLIGPGGGPDGLEDPDARITNDVHTTVGGFSNTFSKALRLVTQGLLFMYKLYQQGGAAAPVSIFAYLVGSTYLVEVIFPVFKSWRLNHAKMAASFGLYRSAMTRLGEKAEAVATLQGADREMAIVRGKFATHMDDCVNMHWAFFKVRSRSWAVLRDRLRVACSAVFSGRLRRPLLPLLYDRPVPKFVLLRHANLACGARRRDRVHQRDGRGAGLNLAGVLPLRQLHRRRAAGHRPARGPAAHRRRDRARRRAGGAAGRGDGAQKGRGAALVQVRRSDRLLECGDPDAARRAAGAGPEL